VIGWLKLLRLPNVFTATADVMMGYLVTHRSLLPFEHFSLLVVASCCLYLSGMVLNDVFDAEIDARDRPDRPIPAGHVALPAARALGWSFMVTGVLAGWVTSIITDLARPGFVACLLACAVLLYDGVWKHTWAAPLAMALCRMLNVLLGMSLARVQQPMADGFAAVPRSWLGHEWLVAAGIGIYIAGVTIFARHEAQISTRNQLRGGLLVLLAGIALLTFTPALTDYQPRLVVPPHAWYLLWAVLTLITGRRCVLAIMQPVPTRVQAAVRHCVHSIIILDAAICIGYVGPLWGLLVLMLIFPTLLLTMWLKAT